MSMDSRLRMSEKDEGSKRSERGKGRWSSRREKDSERWVLSVDRPL